MYPDYIKLFYVEDLSEYLRQKKENIKAIIEQENEDYILNVNEEEYIKHLSEDNFIEPLQLLTDEKYIVETKGNYAENDGWGNSTIVSREIIQYHIPFVGNRILLEKHPNSSLVWTEQLPVSTNEIVIDIPIRSEDSTTVTAELDNLLGKINTQIQNQLPSIRVFNDELENCIKELILKRKEHLIKKSKFIESLGVEIKKNENLPKTFSIPSKITKKITPRPQVANKALVPEPTLPHEIYEDVLKIIHDTGKIFETNPSIYEGKEEEALRDFLLFQLVPRFELSATGESFNKSGKTDILLKYENKNIFIAECKFWNGKVSYFEAISQLLNYLTWRDSKTALVIFVKNKNISSVIQEIENVTKEQSNFVKYVGKSDESWFNFIFSLPNDKEREIKLAVLLFHTPES